MHDPFLAQAVEKLRLSGVENPWREARLLLAHTLNKTYEEVFMGQYAFEVTPTIEKLIERRVAKEPLSKIMEQREFWGHSFYITSDTLDPRFDTETLMEAVLETFPKNRSLRVLDLGTGSGCILISLLKEYAEAVGVGVDISSKALEVARINGERHGVNNRISWVCSDWGSGIQGAFDIIVSNPPYIAKNEVLPLEVIKYDPPEALWGGEDGLECYRRILFEIPRLSARETYVFFECGKGQAEAVSDMCQKVSKQRVFIKSDMLGIPRVAFFAYHL